MRSLVTRALRLARNVVTDLRYGGFLGGSTRSRYAAQGAYDTVNSDYEVLRRVFDGRIAADDVLCDVGCGKGRVLNFWLERKEGRRFVGIEIDPEIAEATRRRLRKHAKCEVITGDAVSALPQDATLFYLYNPFAKEVLEQFRDAVVRRARPARILYYNPLYPDVFQDPSHFSAQILSLGGTAHELMLVHTK
jgi:hypothetical protein